MKIFDIIFNRKNREKVKHPTHPLPSEQLTGEPIGFACASCGEAIYSSQPHSKFQKKFYHKRCFRKMKRAANRQAFG